MFPEFVLQKNCRQDYLQQDFAVIWDPILDLRQWTLDITVLQCYNMVMMMCHIFYYNLLRLYEAYTFVFLVNSAIVVYYFLLSNILFQFQYTHYQDMPRQ